MPDANPPAPSVSNNTGTCPSTNKGPTLEPLGEQNQELQSGRQDLGSPLLRAADPINVTTQRILP